MTKYNWMTWNSAQPTIGSLAYKLLVDGHEPKTIPDKVRRVFPTSDIKIASVYWYASKAGLRLGGSREFDLEALEELVG